MLHRRNALTCGALRGALGMGLLLAGGAAAAGGAYQIDLLSTGLPGASASGESLAKAISQGTTSGNGGFVLFSSRAANLDCACVDRNDQSDVFVYDLASGAIELISASSVDAARTASGASTAVAISDDGRYVLYNSEAADLIGDGGDTVGSLDAFLHDRSTGETFWVTRPGNGVMPPAPFDDSWAVGLSGDGQVVLLESYKRLLTGNADVLRPDVYSYDHASRSVRLVSRRWDSATDDASGFSNAVAISRNGHYALFTNSGSDVLENMVDGNSGLSDGPDVFVQDLRTGTSTLVSRIPGQPLNSLSFGSQAHGISDDGRYVLFSTRASNASAATDDNNASDVFVYDRDSAASELISHRFDDPMIAAAQGFSTGIALSGDGRYVAFEGASSDLIAGYSGGTGILLYDRQLAASQLVTRSFASPTTTVGPVFQVKMNASGSLVSFESKRDEFANLGSSPEDFQAYVYRRDSGVVELLSAAAGVPSVYANGHSRAIAASPDGQWMLVQSQATDYLSNLVDRSGQWQVYRADLGSAARTLISRAAPAVATAASGSTGAYGMSADGRWVLMVSDASDLAAPQVQRKAAYVLDRLSGNKRRVPGSAQNPLATPEAVISRDGRYVAYSSAERDVIPGVIYAPTLIGQTYLVDLQTDSLSLISHTGLDSNQVANGDSEPLAISADGRFILILSHATDSVPGVGNDPAPDLLLYDRTLRQSTLVTVNSDGNSALSAGISHPKMSDNGMRVAYSTDASNVVAGQLPGPAPNVFLYDHAASSTVMLSGAQGSPIQPANGGSFANAISADGNRVLVTSSATDFVSGVIDENGAADVFWIDVRSGERLLLSADPMTPGTTDNRATIGSALNADGLKAYLTSSEIHYLIDVPTLSRSDLSPRIGGLSAPPDSGRLADELSADGRFLLYSGGLDPLSLSNGLNWMNVYIYDDLLKVTRLVTTSQWQPGSPANARSASAQLSRDGSTVLLQSIASDLDSGGAIDGNARTDVFVATFQEGIFADDFD